VTLRVTSDFGCEGVLQKPITITESPAASIANSASCLALPTNFSASGTGIQQYYWEIGTAYYEDPAIAHTFHAAGNHQLKLTIVGNNNCTTTYLKTVSVPVPLVPDFSVSKNCVGEEAVFTDVTSGIDPVVNRQWNFANLGSATGSPVVFPFETTGNKSIQLRVTAQSGCEYTRSKAIVVTDPPVASFTATPDVGGSPLLVQFTNTSSLASRYEWEFADGSGAISTATSPIHTFNNVGEHQVELVAINNENCEDSFTKVIKTLAPLPDVALQSLIISENPDGSLNLIITVQNKGNMFLTDLPIDIDVSGEIGLTEIVEEPIPPMSLYNVVLDYGIRKSTNLTYLCAHVTLPDDLQPADNRICESIENETMVFHPYPNPASDRLNIEWVAPEAGMVTITLNDAFGKTILKVDDTSISGLNSRVVNVGEFQSGLYTVSINAGSWKSVQKIMVIRQN
jgi:PKD repeat protein